MNRFPKVMKTSAAVTGVLAATFAVAYRLSAQGWLLTTAISFGTTFYHFAMRLLAGAIVPQLAKNIRPEHSWFQPQPWETTLHKFLRVKSWKKNLPTYEPGQFDLEKNTLSQVIRNMCNAELVHEVIVVLSFAPLLFAIPFGDFWVFLITSLMAALYDSVFVIAQRYNRPRLVRILKKKEALP